MAISFPPLPVSPFVLLANSVNPTPLPPMLAAPLGAPGTEQEQNGDAASF
jgi:hypothetical protein